MWVSLISVNIISTNSMELRRSANGGIVEKQVIENLSGSLVLKVGVVCESKMMFLKCLDFLEKCLDKSYFCFEALNLKLQC